MMQGFGVHTFRLVNADGRVALRASSTGSRWPARIRWSGTRRSRSPAPTPTSTAATCGKRSRRAPIPEWELGLQIFTEEQAERVQLRRARRDQDRPRRAGAGDAGRPHGAQPQPGQLLRRDRAGGVLHGAHRARASTSRNDPLLAGRIHSYVDTQITRLGGPNFHEIPINAPVAPVHNNQRDGMHRQAIPRGRVAYEPNSLGGGCPFQAGARRASSPFPQPIAGRQGARQAGEVRRPLHPGDAVLRKPDAGREGAHRPRRSASS